MGWVSNQICGQARSVHKSTTVAFKDIKETSQLTLTIQQLCLCYLQQERKCEKKSSWKQWRNAWFCFLTRERSWRSVGFFTSPGFEVQHKHHHKRWHDQCADSSNQGFLPKRHAHCADAQTHTHKEGDTHKSVAMKSLRCSAKHSSFQQRSRGWCHVLACTGSLG